MHKYHEYEIKLIIVIKLSLRKGKILTTLKIQTFITYKKKIKKKKTHTHTHPKTKGI